MSPSITLPDDIFRAIVEVAAVAEGPADEAWPALELLRVSRAVNSWITPIVYHTVVLNTPMKLLAFARMLARSGPSRATLIRNLSLNVNAIRTHIPEPLPAVRESHYHYAVVVAAAISACGATPENVAAHAEALDQLLLGRSLSPRRLSVESAIGTYLGTTHLTMSLASFLETRSISYSIVTHLCVQDLVHDARYPSPHAETRRVVRMVLRESQALERVLLLARRNHEAEQWRYSLEDLHDPRIFVDALEQHDPLQGDRSNRGGYKEPWEMDARGIWNLWATGQQVSTNGS